MRAANHHWPFRTPNNEDAQAEAQKDDGFSAPLGIMVGYLFLFLLALYLVIYGGRFHIVDEISIYAMAENLAKRGSLDTDQIAWTQWVRDPREVQGAFGRGGHVFSKKGFAAALLPAFLVRLALARPDVGLTFPAFFASAILTTLTACLLVLYLCHLGFSERAALGTGLLYGTAMLAVPYTRMLFGEPVAALGLVATLYALQRGIVERPLRWGFWAGVAFAVSVWARAVNAVVLPFLAWYVVLNARSSQNRLAPQGPFARRLGLTFLAVASILGFGGYALYNTYRFGVPWQSGYQVAQGEFFTTPPWVGLYGLLLSPLRGLIWYMPVVVLTPVGFGRLWRTHPLEAPVLVGIVTAYVLLFSSWWMWWGGFAWGPRFLLPVVPLLAVSLAPLWNDRKWRPALAGLGILSAMVQALAVLPDFTLAETLLEQKYGSVVASPALYDPRWAPLVLQARLLAEGFWDVAWFRLGKEALPVVALAAAILGISGIVLWQAGVTRRPREGQKNPRPTGGWPGQRRTSRFALAGIVVLLGLWAGAAGLGVRKLSDRARLEPFEAAAYTALQEIRRSGKPGDVLVTLAPFDYAALMNWAHTPIYTLGLAPHAPPLRPEEEHLLERAAYEAVESIWLIAARIPPGHAEALPERWLSERAFLVSNRWIGELRLVRFARPQDAPQHVVNLAPPPGAALWPERVAFFDWPAKPGGWLRVEVAWRVAAPASQNLTAFVHLLTPEGTYIAGTDGAPVNGYATATTWQTGQRVSDRKAILLPPDVPPGTYVLEVGMYEEATGRRVPLGERTEVLVAPVPIGQP